MRRLPASEATAGMVLAMPLTDAFLNPVLDEQQELTPEVITKLPGYGVDELFVEDEMSADISVKPLVDPSAEAGVVQGLQTLYDECRRAGPVDEAILDLIIQPIHEMATKFFPVGIAELNTAPCTSKEDHLFRLPARAAGMAMLLAAMSGMDEHETSNVGIATALMHTGYARLPQEIVWSTSPLTRLEEHEYKKHPVHGYVLLRDSRHIPRSVAEAVLLSHELLDGSGFPRGLSGGAIPRMARIVSIADAYYSAISPFNRRVQSSRHEALEFLMAFGGDRFDAGLVRRLSRQVPVYPAGVYVRLTSGETGVVTEPNPGEIGRPQVRILRDKDDFEVKPEERVLLNLADPRNRRRVVMEYSAA